jgi:hypothetical protein
MAEGDAFVPAHRGIAAIQVNIMISPIDTIQLIGTIFLIHSTIPGPVAVL